MRTQLVVFVTLLGALLGVGCTSGGDGSSPSVPDPGAYTASLAASTVAGLGPCTAATAGQVGFVTSTQSPYVCLGGKWIAMRCTVALSGAVVYVNVSPDQGVWACVSKAWTQVTGAPGAACFVGESACAGQTPEACVGGQWVFAAAPCAGVCVNGVCGVCSPNAMQCGGGTGNTVQICDGTGQWQDAQTCAGGDPVCQQNGQQAECVCPSPGMTCGNQCVDTEADPSNCGQCGTVCAAQTETCSGGTCTTCPSGSQVCNNVCIDTQSDPNNCGSCGTACTALNQSCVGGTCTCPGNEQVCNDVCVDTQRDPNDCGSCGNACTAPGTSCNSGACTCANGGQVCNNVCVITQLDANNCGGCGIVCGGATPNCANGACTAACVELPFECITLGQLGPSHTSSQLYVNYWTCDQYPMVCVAANAACCIPANTFEPSASGWCCAGPPFVSQ